MYSLTKLLASAVDCKLWTQLNSESKSSQGYTTTDGQSLSLSRCHAPITDLRIICILILLIIFRELWVSWCVAHSLAKRWVCSLKLLLGLASAVFLGRDSDRSETPFLCYVEKPLPSNGLLLQSHSVTIGCLINGSCLAPGVYVTVC